MNSRRTAVAAAVLSCCCLSWPEASQARSKPEQAKFAIRLPELKTWELENGLRVAYMGVHKAPVVSVQVWYRAGAKDEQARRRGSAHMFEHMMFKGTRNLPPEQHAQHINRLGGVLNAFTTEDTTAYHNTLPKDYAGFAIQLEAERMRNLLFRDQMIDIEREVVKEEIRQQENNPVQRGVQRFLKTAYTVHPYAWTAGGSMTDLDNTTAADLEAFYETYYQPNNALLIVVGDVSEAEVKAAAENWFGGIPRGKEPPRPANALTEPVQTAPRREVADESELGLVIAGYHVPHAAAADNYALQVLSHILATGDSSRLSRRLVRTDKTALQAGGELILREHPGLLALFAAYLDPASTETIVTALAEEVETLKSSPPSDLEVSKAKNQLLAAFVFGLEGVSGLAAQIGSSWILSGDPSRFLRELDKFNAVTAAEVQKVARLYLERDNLTVVVIPPKGREGSK